MSLSLPVVGQLSYGSVTFNCTAKTKVTGRPVYDAARRMVKYVQFRIHVEGYLQSDSGTDATMNVWRQQLTTPGLGLYYHNKGFGDFFVNVNSVKDVLWGPMPSLLEFTPLGGNLAAFVVWECEVHVPQCGTAAYSFALCEFNYEVDYDIDEHGLSTVTTSGHIEIANNRYGRAVLDSPDNYLEKIIPDVALGFKRIQRTRRLANNRSRMDFRFVDREIPFPLPAGVTAIDVRHRVRSNLGDGFANWANTISGTVHVAPGMPKSHAMLKFWSILRGRIAATQRTLGGMSNVLLTDVDIDEDVFGLGTSFSVSYIIICSLEQILAASGLWEPTNDSFGAWKASLANSAFHPRGYAKLKFNPASDVLLDLCLTPSAAQPGAASPGNPPSQILQPGPCSGLPLRPEVSWIKYENAIYYEEQGRKVFWTSLRGAEGVIENPPPPGSVANGNAQDMARGTVGPQNETSVPTGVAAYRAQRVGQPYYKLHLIGKATRYGYPIPIPRLISKTYILESLGVPRITHKVIGSNCGVPIYSAKWHVEYILWLKSPTTIDGSANPKTGTDGGPLPTNANSKTPGIG
jgi:hypothetical protein